VECAQGHRHWGRYGAAGLLVHRQHPDGRTDVLLQHRAEWSHFGGTWGLLGGARHSDEPAVTAALREAGEEGGLAADAVRVHGRYDDEHGGWGYATLLARAGTDVAAEPTGGESIDVAWQPADRLDALDLHPGFASTWPRLRHALRPLTVVVDGANVVGSRPDGWWRDRAGAATRLLGRLGPLAADGVPDTALPESLDRAALSHWWPVVTVVVEGAARGADDPRHPGVETVRAPGEGDDAILAAASGQGGPTLVVTADRELRARCTAAGAVVVGPRWLLDLLDATGR
jgi:8-oxo-dGTP pyrophosphatase MutT (NUDIX family)